MVDIGRRLEHKGLIVAAEGNLSVRLGGHAFLVTPAGTGKGALRPQDLLVVDRAGRCAQGRPTSEWPLHRALYEANPEIQCIVNAVDAQRVGAGNNCRVVKLPRVQGCADLADHFCF